MVQKFFLFVTVAVFSMFLLNENVEARYLPTRGNGDKMDKLRELLRELLGNDIEPNEYDSQPRWHPESKLFYKREARTH